MRSSNTTMSLCQGWDEETTDDGTVVILDCTKFVCLGHMCEHHADTCAGVRVLESGIPHGGWGLYATRPFRVNDRIDEYKGLVVTIKEFNASQSDYGVAISMGRVLDAVNSDSCLARFSNDAEATPLIHNVHGRPLSNNAQLVSDRKYGLEYAQPRYKDGVGSRVWLVATHDIAQGEEIYTDYGASYWKESKPRSGHVSIHASEVSSVINHKRKQTGFTGKPYHKVRALNPVVPELDCMFEDEDLDVISTV